MDFFEPGFGSPSTLQNGQQEIEMNYGFVAIELLGRLMARIDHTKRRTGGINGHQCTSWHHSPSRIIVHVLHHHRSAEDKALFHELLSEMPITAACTSTPTAQEAVCMAIAYTREQLVLRSPTIPLRVWAEDTGLSYDDALSLIVVGRLPLARRAGDGWIINTGARVPGRYLLAD